MSDPTAIELAEAVRSGERSARDVLEDHLARIEAGNEALNAFVHLDADGARTSAAAVDEQVAAGVDPGPFAGVPFGVKDLEHCAGMPTSYGSLPFMGRGPVAADSVHVARLRAAGAVPVGKTAAPEFGTLNFTKTKAWGIDPQPLGHRAHARRVERGLGRGGGGRFGAHGHGQRRWRLDAHPGRRSAASWA